MTDQKPEDGLIIGEDGKARCWWYNGLPDYRQYHDEEWGHPVTDDIRLFEKICLEGFQSGLSWLTILRKRENFRKTFAGFDFEKLEAAAGGSAQGAEAAFADGVSTTAGDELSGRGVGLSAVREELAAAGYSIELSNRDEGGARVRLSPKKQSSLFG